MSIALVTGGAGFIGSHLTRRLVNEGFDVVVVDDLSWGRADSLPPGVRLVRGDVGDAAVLDQVGGGVSHVFHFAALISAQQSLSEPDIYIRSNVNGTLRLIQQCARWRPCRFVFASTSGVYAGTPDVLKRETDSPRPTTIYALTKLSSEHLLSVYRKEYGFDDVSLRFFNVYGPGQSTRHPYANVACRFAYAAALNLPVQLYGDGAQTRDFIYIDDVVDAIVAAAKMDVVDRVLNVGTGTQSSIRQLLELAQELAGTRLNVEQLPHWKNDIDAIQADNTLLQRSLGVTPRVELREGLLETIRFFGSLGSNA